MNKAIIILVLLSATALMGLSVQQSSGVRYTQSGGNHNLSLLKDRGFIQVDNLNISFFEHLRLFPRSNGGEKQLMVVRAQHGGLIAGSMTQHDFSRGLFTTVLSAPRLTIPGSLSVGSKSQMLFCGDSTINANLDSIEGGAPIFTDASGQPSVTDVSKGFNRTDLRVFGSVSGDVYYVPDVNNMLVVQEPDKKNALLVEDGYAEENVVIPEEDGELLQDGDKVILMNTVDDEDGGETLPTGAVGRWSSPEPKETSDSSEDSSLDTDQPSEELSDEETDAMDPEEAAKEAEQVVREEEVRLEAEQAAREEAARLADAQAAREEAARLAAEKAAREEAARLAAEQSEREESARLADAQAAREEEDRLAAEKAAREEAARLAAEQSEREEARLAAEKARERLTALDEDLLPVGERDDADYLDELEFEVELGEELRHLRSDKMRLNIR